MFKLYVVICQKPKIDLIMHIFHPAVGANKEWKPKSTHTNSAQASGTPGTSDVSTVVEAVSESLPVLSENTSLKLEKKLDELQLSDRQHVIIPNHLQVPESERHGLNFGSFESSFNLSISFANGPVSDMSIAPPPESSQEIKENVEDPSLRLDTSVELFFSLSSVH